MDNETILAIATLIGSVAAAIVSVVTALRVGTVAKDVVGVKKDVELVHVNTNSMKDELVKVTKIAYLAQGAKEERDAQKMSEADQAIGAARAALVPPPPAPLPSAASSPLVTETSAGDPAISVVVKESLSTLPVSIEAPKKAGPR